MPQKKSHKKPISRRAKIHRHAKAHTSHLRQIMGTESFGRLYATGSVLLLLVTTLFWSLLSARIQLSNADQLVNVYLSENSHVFQNALLPGQHTFLMKWPLFWLTQIYGAGDAAFMAFTLITVVVTVGVLAAVLYMLERRPLVFGTLCLALASALLLVPAQPYPGALLPVNMAMMATRNLEYVLYIAAIILFVRSPRLKSWTFWLATALLSLLIASDKLFLSLSLGGALMAVVIYALLKRLEFVKMAGLWLLMAVISGAIATGTLYLLDFAQIVHISSQGEAAPYAITSSVRQLVLGIIFAGFGVLSNFGANIADGVTIWRDAPRLAYEHFTSPGGLAYIANIATFAAGIVMSWKILLASFLKPKHKKWRADNQSYLSLILLWTGLASVVVFVISNHYYPVDARYLTIVFFAVFVAIATYSAQRKWQSEKLILIGLGLIVSCILGLAAAAQSYTSSTTALAATNNRNSLVAEALVHHPVTTLLGDYWRVLPIKQLAHSKANVQVTPYSSCLVPREALSSKAWQVDLKTRSFAYLLSLDQHSPDFSACTLEDVIGHYGRPNSSVVIAGSVEKPQEVLLFYDHGTNSVPPIGNEVSLASAILPIPLDKLPDVQCDTSTTMNIVAHEDDDLLFLSPDLIDSIKSGQCVRSIYITAGDAGASRLYWLSREQGSKAAYDMMDGPDKDTWIDRVVKVGSSEFVTISSPVRHPNLSLIFLRLPDGNLNGGGFAASRHQSLEQLNSGRITEMESVDGQSSYTSQGLITMLRSLMDTYRPAEIRTQSPVNMSEMFTDHSDHLATGDFVRSAYDDYQYHENTLIKYYVGYPVRNWDQNVFDDKLREKQAAFFAYGRFDGSVCDSVEICEQTPTYHSYLNRQYEVGIE